MGAAWELQAALEEEGPWVVLRRHFYGEAAEETYVDTLGFVQTPWLVEGGGAPGWRLFRVVQNLSKLGVPHLRRLSYQMRFLAFIITFYF